VLDKKYALAVKVPSWRATKDINTPEDLVEEVARIYGYGNIPTTLPSFPIKPPEINHQRRLENQLKDMLVLAGRFFEVYNYSFVSPEAIKIMGGTVNRYVELANPLSKERPYLRRNLLINLLDNIRKNIEYSSELRLFEVGKVFLAEEPGARVEPNKGDLLPRQDTWLTAVYAAKRDREPFWEARRTLETVMAGAGIKFVLEIAKEKQAWQHPTRLGEIKVNGQKVGAIYEVTPSVASAFGLDVKVGVVEINLDRLAEIQTQKEIRYQPVPVYPEAERDLGLVVDKNLSQAKVMEVLIHTDPLVKSVRLFDVYSGANLPTGKKSLTYRLSFGVADRTLKTEEVDTAQAKIIKNLEQKFGAEVRK
jgi:phenylalanyl-tRNA synthetase beta chain